jgi:hypothetical protein
MDFQVTIRHGRRTQRYMTISVAARDAAEAMALASGKIPAEVVPEVDLVEIRLAPDFDKRFPDTGAEAATPPETPPRGHVGREDPGA